MGEAKRKSECGYDMVMFKLVPVTMYSKYV